MERTDGEGGIIVEKNILIVSHTQGYLMLSLKEKFAKTGYNVIYVAPDIDKINKIEEPVSALLIYGDEQVAESKSVLVYLKDWVAERDIPIFATGSTDELQVIRSAVGEHALRQTFARPLNAKDMVWEISRYVTKYGTGVKKKILVVDDSGAMLRNVKRWLEDHYQVILANSGAMAIKYLAVNRPDLILLDYEMPILDGRQMLEMIRAENEFADIPVIFLTSKDDRESVMQVMSLKPEGYLLKMQPPGEIVKAIDDFFEKRKGNRDA